MKKDFTIRPALVDDLSEMQAILKSASRDWSAGILPTCFGEGYYAWVIGIEDEIFGFAVVKDVGEQWEILQIVIDTLYQQQGLASRLLEFIMTEAREKQIKKMHIEVRQSNSVAMSLYRKFKFKEVGLRKKYYGDGEDAVVMSYP